MAIEWSLSWEDSEGAKWYADLGHFEGNIIFPVDGRYRLLVSYDRQYNGDSRMFDTLQEAQDAAVPLTMEMLDRWREELLKLMPSAGHVQCEHTNETLGRCVREWGHPEGEHRYK